MCPFIVQIITKSKTHGIYMMFQRLPVATKKMSVATLTPK